MLFEHAANVLKQATRALELCLFVCMAGAATIGSASQSYLSVHLLSNGDPQRRRRNELTTESTQNLDLILGYLLEVPMVAALGVNLHLATSLAGVRRCGALALTRALGPFLARAIFRAD